MAWGIAGCMVVLTACSTTSRAASTGDCPLLTSREFEAVLGPEVGPAKSQVLPLPNGVTGHECVAIAGNGDTFLVGWLHFPTSAAATRAYNGDISRGPVPTVHLVLPHGLATRQYAVLDHRNGLNSAAYLLRGRDELTFRVATTVADEHLFNEQAYRNAIVIAARNWRTG